MASRSRFLSLSIFVVTKPLITFKRGGLKIFWDSQTHGLTGPQKPAVSFFFNSVWLASTGRKAPETNHQLRLAQTDSDAANGHQAAMT
jgi:hypothetical protein